MKERKYFFIVGIGRSGTTLLLSMLNRHTKIIAFPEIRFFNFFYHSWKNKKVFNNNDFHSIHTFLLLHKTILSYTPYQWNEERFRGSMSITKNQRFDAIYKAFYDSFSYNNSFKDAAVSLDKNPINTLYVPQILKQFPEAKFILMIRDPRANYLSRKQKIIFSKNIYFNCFRWNYYNEKALKFQQENPDKIHTVMYEDLVTNPESELTKIASFCGIDYSQSLHSKETEINIHDSDTMLKTDKSGLLERKIMRLNQPTDTTRKDTWKTELTPKEIEIIQSICGPTANKFGYTIPFSKRKYSLNYFFGFAKSIFDIIKNKILFISPLSLKLWMVKRKSG